MGNMLVEKLIDLRRYQFELFYELPVDFSVSSSLEINAWVEDLQQSFSYAGLLIKGTVLERIRLTSEKNSLDQDEQVFYFTYLLPNEDLKTNNLLNLDYQLQISQIHYHLIQKKGRVFLKQQLQIDLELRQYTVENMTLVSLDGLERKTGTFLKKYSDLEKSFLKSYAIDLPVDFFSLIKISGKVDDLVFEIIQDGCLIDFVALLQGEYVNTQKQIGMVFLEKKEHFFIPFPELNTSSSEEIRVQIDLKELSWEKDQKLLLLYQCQIEFFRKAEIAYYTGDQRRLPEGSKLENYEVEETSLPLKTSQMFKEKKQLGQLKIKQIIRISGELTQVKIEEIKLNNVTHQLLISGQIEYICCYLDEQGIEKTIFGDKPIEQLIPAGKFDFPKTGYWQLESSVDIPTWELVTAELAFEIIIDLEACYHYFVIEPILISCPVAKLEREKLYLLQQVSTEQVYFPADAKIYLERYAQQISQIENRVTHWQKRQIAGGWLISGNGELIIYYLTEAGEFHHAHRFSFSQYLPTEDVRAQEMRLQPEVQTLDSRLLEDGSLASVKYLLWLKYHLFQRKEESVIREIKLAQPEGVRPIVQMDKLEQRLEQVISLKKGAIFADQVKKVEGLELKIGNYQWKLTNRELKITGEIEIQIRYMNTRRRELLKVYPIQFAFLENIDLEGEVWSDEEIRIAPLIKNYEYSLNSLPTQQKMTELYLSIQLEIDYRILGKSNFS